MALVAPGFASGDQVERIPQGQRRAISNRLLFQGTEPVRVGEPRGVFAVECAPEIAYNVAMAAGPKSRWMNVAERTIQRWLPPVAVDALKRSFGSVHFEGNYSSWSEAAQACEGYGTDVVLERVVAAATAVKEGRAAYERDSLVFHESAYEWPLLSCLLWAANHEGGALNVLDFGGSLGSSYYQHRAWLQGLRRLRWSIVEQQNFVRVGRERFQDDTLRFFPDVDNCIQEEKPTVLMLSGVLQYLEDPYALLNSLLDKAFEVIILDRTPLLDSPKSRITLQRVGERIYPATYPAWFFSRTEFLRVFEGRYRLIQAFDCADRVNLPSRFQGFLFERITR
jgi:putative methyltransferase (TIGR04325 family)